LGFKVDDSGREQYNKGIDQTKQKQQSLTAAFLKANLIMSAASKVMGAAFGFVRDSVIGATAETERYRVTLGTMMGDQEKANKIIHDLDYSPVSDFYGTANAIGGLQGMVTFGMQAEEASDILTRIGDIAQGNSEAFVSMSNNMGQVFAKGKADATDLKQFVMQGFDVVGEVAKQSGKSREEIQKAGVTYEQTAAALKALTSDGGKYNGMLAKQMNTLGGVLKQFASLKAATAEAIGTGVSNELKDLLKYILQIGRAGQDSFVNVFVKAIKEVIHWIWQIIIMWKVLGYRIADMGDALTPVKGFFSSLRDVVGDVLTGIMNLVVDLGKGFLALSIPITAFLTPIIQAFGRIVKKVLTGIGEIINEISPMFLEWVPIFDAIGKIIGNAFEKIMPVLENVKNAIIAAVTPIKAFLKPIVESLQPLFEKVFGAIGKLFDQSKKDTDGLANVIKGLTPVFSLLGNVVAFVVDVFGTGLAGIVDVIGPFIKYILIIVGIIKAWSIIQGILNAVMAMNPIGAIIIAIVALIAGIGLLIKNWDKVKEGFANAGKAIGNFFSGAGEKIKSFAGSVAEKIGSVFSSLKGKASEGAQKMAAAFAERFPNLYQFIVDLFSKIKEVFSKLVDIIRPPIEAFLNVIKTGFSAIIGIFKVAGLSIFNVMKTIFTSIWNIIKTIFISIWGVIKSVFDAVKNIVMAVFNVFKTIFISIFNVIKGVFSTIFNTVLSVFDGIIGIWRGGGNIFSKIWESIKLAFTSAFNAILDIARIIGNAFTAIWESVKGYFIAIWEGVSGVFKSIWSGIVNIFTVYIEGIKNIIASIAGSFLKVWEQVKQGVVNVAGAIIGFWQSVINAVKNILSGIVDFFKKWGEVILQILAVIIFGIPGLIAVSVRQIIKHWEVIGPKVKAVWEKIKAFFIVFGRQIVAIFETLVNKIKQAFQWVVDRAMAIWNTLKSWFAKLVESIKNIWGTITDWFSMLWEGIVSVAINVWNAFKGWITAFVEAIKSVWDAITGFFTGLWDGIVDAAKSIWEGLKSWFGSFIEGVKAVWNVIVAFFTGLWDGIVNTAMAIWDTLKSWFSGLVEGIKSIWNGITGFFTGLWDALMQGPAAAIEYIKNAFFGLFNSVQEKLFGFINTIKEGWETVKGFFGGVIDGVVNFFTGGDDSLAKDAPAKVNDMILTPEGQFETNPNDYIMAMQDPSSLVRSGQEQGNSEQSSIGELVKVMVSSIQIATGMIVNAIRGIVFGTNNQYNIINSTDNRADNRAYNASTDNRADNRAYNSTSTTNAYSYGGNASTIYNTFSENGGLMGMFALLRDPLLKMVDMLAGFLMVQQPQASYAGGASQTAIAGAVGQSSNYAYTAVEGNSTVNVQNSMTVNVPPGTSQEQTESIARQVGAQFEAKLAGVINSSRGNIPSPEVRRH
jgi:phage-related protein